MGLQLIFVVETDKKSKTDYIYIRSVLEYYYNALTKTDIKVSAVYMNGKGNYNDSAVTSRIKELVEGLMIKMLIYYKNLMETKKDG